jgi:chorismate-pyruvate lyase
MLTDRRLRVLQERLADSLLWPLNIFHGRQGREAPSLTPLFGHQIPAPFRELLVHENDMTPTLEAHYGGSIHIECLHVIPGRDEMFREVLLRLDADERPVEYGASRVFLKVLPAPAQALLRAGRMPLGTILQVCACPHRGQLGGFFRIGRTDFFEQALGRACSAFLYGRRNTLVTPDGAAIAEVCEILPPAAERD